MRNPVARIRPAWIAVLVSLIVVKGESSVQKIAGNGPPPCSKNTPVSLDNIENFIWSYCDFDLRPFWRSLGIPATRFEYSPSLFSVSSSFGDLDGDMVDERILHIQQLQSITRIIVLKRTPQNTWTSLGFVDIPIFHLYPEARVVTNGRGRWLAVSHHTEVAWGTGIFQEDETWYASEKGRLVEVLSFPAEGHNSGRLAVKWSGHAQPKPFDGSEDRVDIEYTMMFSDVVPDSFRQTISFVKQPASQNFQFDSKASKISPTDFQSIYHIDASTWPKFFKVLRSIAPDPNSARELQKRMLASCREILRGSDYFCDDIAQ
jgi:hypothetical protein